ncbi:MAG: type III-B CRISPR module RAMP protein Cmr1 [Acidobacteriota bacterium]|jgi:hypothetical protein
MNFLDLKLETVTPVFLAGANQREVEVRAPSVKGLLRWWWRASEGHRFSSPTTLAEAEAYLFGSAALKLRSPLQVDVRVRAAAPEPIPRGQVAPTSSAQYSFRQRDRREGTIREGRAQAVHYLGYGPIRIPIGQERAAAEQGRDPALLGPDRRPRRTAVYVRPALAPRTPLALRLAWPHRRLESRQLDELWRTCAAWLALGGLGCRSRKGFGSLDLVGVEASDDQLQEHAGRVLRERMEELHASGEQLPRPLPRWPQVKYRRILHITDSKGSWEEALGALALAYREVRPRQHDRQRRFICGEAEPRRASSVLLSVHRQGQRFIGLMVALPCWKGETVEAREAWSDFLGLGHDAPGGRERG